MKMNAEFLHKTRHSLRPLSDYMLLFILGWRMELFGCQCCCYKRVIPSVGNYSIWIFFLGGGRWMWNEHSEKPLFNSDVQTVVSQQKDYKFRHTVHIKISMLSHWNFLFKSRTEFKSKTRHRIQVWPDHGGLRLKCDLVDMQWNPKV